MPELSMMSLTSFSNIQFVTSRGGKTANVVLPMRSLVNDKIKYVDS